MKKAAKLLKRNEGADSILLAAKHAEGHLVFLASTNTGYLVTNYDKAFYNRYTFPATPEGIVEAKAQFMSRLSATYL